MFYGAMFYNKPEAVEFTKQVSSNQTSFENKTGFLGAHQHSAYIRMRQKRAESWVNHSLSLSH